MCEIFLGTLTIKHLSDFLECHTSEEKFRLCRKLKSNEIGIKFRFRSCKNYFNL